MQNTVEQTMDAVVAATRAQVMAEMKAQAPAVAPRRVFRRDRLLELKAAANLGWHSAVNWECRSAPPQCLAKRLP